MADELMPKDYQQSVIEQLGVITVEHHAHPGGWWSCTMKVMGRHQVTSDVVRSMAVATGQAIALMMAWKSGGDDAVVATRKKFQAETQGGS